MVGQFFTPEIVAKCMFRLAGAGKGRQAMDPSCGDGSFLRTAPPGLDIHGCEMDPRYAALAADLLQPGRFFPGDALDRTDELEERFDLVIGNPPFSAQQNRERRMDVLGKFDLGRGKKSQCLEVLFIELFWRLAKPGGRIAVILPDGPLANAPMRFVREWLLYRSRIDAIISLPRDTFAGTSAKTHIVLATKRPVSKAPYTESTWLLRCGSLGQLQPIGLEEWIKAGPGWNQCVLADRTDWRPEATLPGSYLPNETHFRLGDRFHVRTGAAKYGVARRLLDAPRKGTIPLIRAKNLSPGGGVLLDRNLAYIAREGPMFREKALVREGELLFVRVGAGCYGRTAMVPPGLVAQADDWIHILTPTGSFDTAAVADWFNSDAGRSAVAGLAKGVGAVSISKSALSNLPLPAGLFRVSGNLGAVGECD